MVKLSVVIPVYNEQKNVVVLVKEIESVLNNLTQDYEILFVDDGSKDNTFGVLASLYSQNKKIKVMRFRTNFGQTAALDAGLKAATGDYIVTMDGDLQNDPRDIPRLLNKLNEGYDVVSGWRHNRKDTFFKLFFSRVSYLLRDMLTKDKVHDSGCSLKVYRRKAIEGLHLFGEMHRYITSLVVLRGFKVGELKVNHRPRIAGKTKYNYKRLLKGVLDLLFVKFWMDFSTRPLHFFGFLGFLQYLFAVIVFIEQIIKALLIGKLIVGPLLLLGVLLVITGSLFILCGLLGEIQIRTYYAIANRNPYDIEKILK